jgi:ribonuclease HII
MESIASHSQTIPKKSTLLERFYDSSSPQIELCIDEAGRGCLFGRVYIACVVLPKDISLFSGENIKDSKKFSSKKKINQVAETIRQQALAWHVAFVDAEVIDKINILQSVMRGMHECIQSILLSKGFVLSDCRAVIDGNYFTPFRQFDESTSTIVEMPFVTIEQGDAKYMGIAAASILAKTARDAYILDLCQQHPDLVTHYGLQTNMGYGTKTHLEGIRTHGITPWHRKTFGATIRDTLSKQTV